ncbi:hypothetical protein C8P68_104333 [Mucilaginibacter yixingensis]|uniref:Uncharacterized protein n=2 Tax=Mucilaginibacter yixingensis TaxID=1295612 RepID=A0A2T5J9U2_9SPHI|nr:hypothetical protein C8P68_104333 [Mucilaginibacter yixingensis]
MLVPTACKKSNNDLAASAVSLKFKFNGSAQAANTVIATYYKSQGTVQIMGSMANSTQVLNLMVNNVKVGTFDVATGDAIASYSIGADLDHSYLGTTGKIVITKFTTEAVGGTFQFSSVAGVGLAGTFTEGTFLAKLITM